ncbi:MAG: hypothetical protein ACYTG0_34200 [Planctomycetota bacterium]
MVLFAFRVFEDAVAEMVFWAAVVAVAVVVAVYVVGKIRAEAVQQELTPTDLASKFDDLHSKGELSDEEYRTIRTTLAARLQSELKDDDQAG